MPPKCKCRSCTTFKIMANKSVVQKMDSNKPYTRALFRQKRKCRICTRRCKK